MTIEQKARAYDEVRKKIALRFGSNVVEEIFSEFEMSEDERMVKFIKNQLFNIKKTITENYELDAKLTKAIEWLEKQGSPVLSNSSNIGKNEPTKRSEEDEEYNGEDYGIDSLFHAQRILEKTLGKVDGYQTDDGILEHKCAISAVKKLYEQKPDEWSEEDESKVDDVIYFLDTAKTHYASTEAIDDCVTWLKSLKERIEDKA